ncbi:hypothetical protein RND71_024005 [Anisodus tanguticus]|uniref:Uncharacterized protein n=1 Tax=Anisodus tanguticus TaxID=243964 RepID=A0AAE1RVG9_9SOLA|nr:hypothetical protein RND71_024005 [Anisodus tanguticus]
MRKSCCDNKEEMHRGAWSKQEDQKLVDYITKHGEGCWKNLPKAAGSDDLSLQSKNRYDQRTIYALSHPRKEWRDEWREIDCERVEPCCECEFVSRWCRQESMLRCSEREIFSDEEEDLIIRLHALLGNSLLYNSTTR